MVAELVSKAGNFQHDEGLKAEIRKQIGGLLNAASKDSKKSPNKPSPVASTAEKKSSSLRRTTQKRRISSNSLTQDAIIGDVHNLKPAQDPPSNHHGSRPVSGDATTISKLQLKKLPPEKREKVKNFSVSLSGETPAHSQQSPNPPKTIGNDSLLPDLQLPQTNFLKISTPGFAGQTPATARMSYQPLKIPFREVNMENLLSGKGLLPTPNSHPINNKTKTYTQTISPSLKGKYDSQPINNKIKIFTHEAVVETPPLPVKVSSNLSYSRDDLLALRFCSHPLDSLRDICNKVNSALKPIAVKGKKEQPPNSSDWVSFVNRRTKKVIFVSRLSILEVQQHREINPERGDCVTSPTLRRSPGREKNCFVAAFPRKNVQKIPAEVKLARKEKQIVSKKEEVSKGETLFVHFTSPRKRKSTSRNQGRRNPSRSPRLTVPSSTKFGTCISIKRPRSWLQPKQLGRSIRRCSVLNQRRQSITVVSSERHQRVERPFIHSQKRKLISEDNFDVVKVSKLEASFLHFRLRYACLDLEFHSGVSEIVPQQSPMPP